MFLKRDDNNEGIMLHVESTFEGQIQKTYPRHPDAVTSGCDRGDSTISFDEFVELIDMRHPVYIGMSWDWGGAHAIVVAGYNTRTERLYCIDPWRETSTRFYFYNNLVEGTTIATGTGHYARTITY